LRKYGKYLVREKSCISIKPPFTKWHKRCDLQPKLSELLKRPQSKTLLPFGGKFFPTIPNFWQSRYRIRKYNWYAKLDGKVALRF